MRSFLKWSRQNECTAARDKSPYTHDIAYRRHRLKEIHIAVNNILYFFFGAISWCWIVIVGCCRDKFKWVDIFFPFIPVIFDASQQCCMMMNSPQGALKAINLTCMRYTYIWNKTNFWAGTRKSAGSFQRRRQKMQISNSILTTSRRYGWRIFDHSLLFREICVLQAYENSFVTKVDDSWTLKRCLCSVYMRTDTI